MELVLTEARTGGFRAHRPTCKKIGDEVFDADELSPEALQDAKPCSSCKPKDVDMEAMKTVAPTPTHVLQGEPVSEGVDDDDGFLDDEDLIGDIDVDDLEPEAETAPPAPRDPPKPKPAPAKAKDPELKVEEADALVLKVVNHLGITLPEGYTFPGFGKAIKSEDKQTVYLNSKGTADVRASSPEQAAAWVKEGLAERRGGNYVRVAVRDL